ncbi:MAG: TrmH family RNA methyltransferase [Eubacteriales bacterium]|nr:TrmH family RNA methyltransferase [Eubacteriales bacterium]
MAKLEPYDRSLPYSYALGAFPCLQLLAARPEIVRRLLLHPDGLESEGVRLLREKCAALNVREEQAERVLRRESKKGNCFAALVFEKYEAEPDAQEDHVVLNNISDSGNLGTALRSCLGLGVKNVACIRPCVDIFEPHTVRSSMGAVFSMNVRVFDTFEEYRALFPQHTLYPFMLKGSTELEQAAAHPQKPWSLVFGNEGSGLPEEFADMGVPVRIPMSSEIDSYNLAVSVAIGAYAFTRK